MRPPDEKKYSLVSRTPSRRHISARDFSLPKPYRMPAAADPARGRSRLRKLMLAFSGLLVASLIAALATLVHDNATSPHALAIVEAESTAPPPAVRRAARARAEAQEKAAERATAPVMATPAAIESPTEQPSLAELIPENFGAELQPDPDVVLITAILLLSAAPASTAPDPCAVPSGDLGCTSVTTMAP